MQGWIGTWGVLVIFLVGCAQTSRVANELQAAGDQPILPSQEETVTVQVTPSEKPEKDLDDDALANMVYRIPMLSETLSDFGSQDDTVLLANGFFEQRYPDSASGILVNLVKAVEGDVNQDNVPDAAVILVLDLGGSGSFYHLAVVLGEDGVLRNTDTILLGDRTKVEQISIQDGEVSIDLVEHAPDDPLCCPTMRVKQVYQLDSGRLVLISEAPTE